MHDAWGVYLGVTSKVVLDSLDWRRGVIDLHGGENTRRVCLQRWEHYPLRRGGRM